jgi:hypothetical protein
MQRQDAASRKKFLKIAQGCNHILRDVPLRTRVLWSTLRCVASDSPSRPERPARCIGVMLPARALPPGHQCHIGPPPLTTSFLGDPAEPCARAFGREGDGDTGTWQQRNRNN